MNDPIRSVALARPGVERRGGVDAAAQQRFLAMLATVRPVELGDDVGGEAARAIDAPVRASSIAAPGSEPATRRDLPRPEPASRLEPASRREALATTRMTDAGHASVFDRFPAADRSAPVASSPSMASAASRHQAGSPMRMSDAEARGQRADTAGHGVAAPRASGALAPAHVPAPPVGSFPAPQQAAGMPGTAMPAAGDPSPAIAGKRHEARMTAAERGHAPRPGARTDGVELLLLQGLPEARASLAALAASEEAPREIPPAMVEAHAPRADARPQQALRAVSDAAEGEAEAGAPADAPDAELGALLRHMSGSGAPLRAQRMADGSWVARLVFPGEGAVSIRISQSPDLVSVRLGGDGELAKRVREAIEGGLARPGRRVAVDTTDAG